MKHRIVLVTGGFDPLHSGHIAYFTEAKKLGSKLVVGLNSDSWLTRKKGKPFLTIDERKIILEALEIVDSVITFNDSDGSANLAIYKCLQQYPECKIIFANDGDRTNTNTPEYETYGKMNWVEFKWGVGGTDKKNSSSVILDNWKTQHTERKWGYWRVLDDKGTIKTKELVIDPGCSLSDQRHFYRSEHWYVLTGNVQIDTECNGKWQIQMLSPNTTYVIGPNVWHKTTNTGDTPAHIIEIQYGERCVEDDIERR